MFATIDPTLSYWSNAFFILILMPAADTIFIVGNLFTISTMDAKSQALAGGLFSTVTRVRAPPSISKVHHYICSLNLSAVIYSHRSCRHVCDLDYRDGKQIPRLATVPRYLAAGLPSCWLDMLRHGGPRYSIELLLASRSRGHRRYGRRVRSRN